MQPDIFALLRQAQQAIAGGRFADADALSRRAVGIDPGNTQAKLLGAVAAGRLGQAPRAIQLYREVLEVDPRSFDAIQGLAVMCRSSGQVTQAIELCSQAIQLRPNDPNAYLNLGRCYLADRRPEEALLAFERAVSLQPSFAPAHNDRGAALQAQGRSLEAAEAYRRAIALDPNSISSYVGLGHLLLANGNPADAVSCFRRAYELGPNHVPAHVVLARALIEEGKFGEAEERLRHAIFLDPRFAEAYMLLGRILQQLGRFEEADALLEQALSLQPNRAATYYTIINGKKVTEADRPLLERASAILSADNLPLEERRPLHYALGKAFDDLGDYETAMRHFEEANRISQKRLDLAGRSFDRERHRRRVDDAIRTYTSGFFEHNKHAGLENDKPVFIVGMARSGTTLLEQIVSSHPEVGAAGELGYWLSNGNSVIAEDGSVDSATARRLAEEYVGLLESKAPGKRLVTNKMPQNFVMLGPICLALPRARIVHCRRSPLDTCLSIYTTSFNSGPDFAHDRENLVFAYRQYLRLMAHWREVLSREQFLEIDYEELVARREEVARAIIDFLGLEWSEQCLHHERNEHAISTPSLWQARQPVYASSVGRWRRYEPWLGAFRELLAEEASDED